MDPNMAGYTWCRPRRIELGIGVDMDDPGTSEIFIGDGKNHGTWLVVYLQYPSEKY